MDKSKITLRIIDIIASQTLCRAVDLSGSTRLYHDLKISGDDVLDLLDKITEEFQVSFENFDLCHRFPSEKDERSFFFWIKKLCGQTNELFIVTTIDDLVDFVLINQGKTLKVASTHFTAPPIRTS